MEDQGWVRFRKYWLGHVTSFIGDYFTVIAFPLAALELTNSAFFAGSLEFIELATSMVFGIWIGGFADRSPSRAAIVTADVVRAVAIGGLAVMFFADVASPVVLALTVFVMAAFRDLHDSAEGSFIANVVPDSHITKAGAFLARSDGIGHITGALVGGFAASVGLWLAFGIDAATFVVAALASYSVGHIARKVSGGADPQVSEDRDADEASLRDALRWLREEDGYWRVVVSGAVGNITAACFLTQFVVLAERTLHLPAWQIGATFACLGVGSLVSSAWCERQETIRPWLLPASDAIIGASAVACGLFPRLGVIIAAFLAAGAATTVAVIGAGTLRLRRFPTGVQGRMAMISRVAVRGLLMPAILFAGWLADRVSSTALFITYGIIGLIAALIGVALRVPGIDATALPDPRGPATSPAH